MDETDLLIIKRMMENARVSFRKIAKELGVSPDTVISRYKTLQEKGVIRGSTVVINPKKIGYHGMAVFMIDASPTHIFTTEVAPTESSLILEKLIQMRNIILATKTVGDHDLLAIAVARDFEHLIAIGADIAKIPGVKDLRVSFWVEKAELCPQYFII
ncbi:MAG: Lrp/AsnC family transcriptional regulator [Candidatus Bathyarchaeota archaeon]|nr:Lrp/AsnC family transcriptional regulator [Candidatus Bathyarchaeota archaeon]MDH5713189.1 Lrp/AsnC family transcriptional regulator [Candidatus Bathyarchaeota archaeon]